MRTLFSAQKNYILSSLNAGHSAHSIASTSGIHASTISRLHSKEHSKLLKFAGGRLSKLSPANFHYAVHLITTWRSENAVQVIKTPRNVINQPLFPSTVHLNLKKTGIKAVVKKKHPLFSARHRNSYLDFAHAYKDWTVKDWKRVIWSDETKINCLGSDGCKWV